MDICFLFIVLCLFVLCVLSLNRFLIVVLCCLYSLFVYIIYQFLFVYFLFLLVVFLVRQFVASIFFAEVMSCSHFSMRLFFVYLYIYMFWVFFMFYSKSKTTSTKKYKEKQTHERTIKHTEEHAKHKKQQKHRKNNLNVGRNRMEGVHNCYKKDRCWTNRGFKTEHLITTIWIAECLKCWWRVPPHVDTPWDESRLSRNGTEP